MRWERARPRACRSFSASMALRFGAATSSPRAPSSRSGVRNPPASAIGAHPRREVIAKLWVRADSAGPGGPLNWSFSPAAVYGTEAPAPRMAVADGAARAGAGGSLPVGPVVQCTEIHGAPVFHEPRGNAGRFTHPTNRLLWPRSRRRSGTPKSEWIDEGDGLFRGEERGQGLRPLAAREPRAAEDLDVGAQLLVDRRDLGGVPVDEARRGPRRVIAAARFSGRPRVPVPGPVGVGG